MAKKTKAKEQGAKTEVAKLRQDNVPAELVDSFLEDEGVGVDFDSADVQLPFLQILQSVSHQVKKADPKFIQGAEEGMIFNTLTEELIPGETGVLAVPCVYEKLHCIWRPRKIGGGFLGSHPYEVSREEPCTRDPEKGDLILPDGNILEPTAQYYILMIREAGEVERVVLSLSRTGMRASRKWNALLASKTFKTKGRTVSPPLYSSIYQLKPTSFTNPKGTWYGWGIENYGWATKTIYELAKTFHKQVTRGEIVAKPPESTEDEGTGGKDEAAAAEEPAF